MHDVANLQLLSYDIQAVSCNLFTVYCFGTITYNCPECEQKTVDWQDKMETFDHETWSYVEY
jgi:hypothetical protein